MMQYSYLKVYDNVFKKSRKKAYRRVLTVGFIFCFWAVTSSCFCQKITDLGVFGTVFPIQEQQIMEVLTSKMQGDEGKKLLKGMEDQLNQIRQSQHIFPKPLSHITSTPKHDSFLFDPSLFLKQDLKDHKGTRFYKAGTRVNPLDTMTLSKRYVFIDGERPQQIDWAKRMQSEQQTMIILVKGDPINVMNDEKIPVFFDQDGVMVDRFHLKHVPCSMHQEGKLLRITEWTEDEIEGDNLEGPSP